MKQETINIEKRSNIKRNLLLAGLATGTIFLSKSALADVFIGQNTNQNTVISKDLIVKGTNGISLGDADTGFYESADDVMRIKIAGTDRAIFDANEFRGLLTNSFLLLNETASATNPTLCPAKSDLDTGIGWASADNLSLITGGTERIRMTDTGLFYFYDGTTTHQPLTLTYDTPTDIGIEKGSSRVGIRPTYITDKAISNCTILGNSNTIEGSIRVANSEFQIYLNGSWQAVVTNFRFRETTSGTVFEHKPIGYTLWIGVMSGNSSNLGLNGRPLVQQYVVSMGAYPSRFTIQLNGGTF